MAEHDLYPATRDEDRAELLEEYQHYFQGLRDFTRTAAQKGQALVLIMT